MRNVIRVTDVGLAVTLNLVENDKEQNIIGAVYICIYVFIPFCGSFACQKTGLATQIVHILIKCVFCAPNDGTEN